MNLPVRQRYKKITTALIERRLPGPGKILVTTSEKVSPEDIIGVAEVSGGFRSIDLAQVFGLPKNNVEKTLTKKIGEVIYKGEILAKRSGLLGLGKKEYLSPVDGVIEEVSQGKAVIRFAPTEVKVSAGFTGQIDQVFKDEGVTISSRAARFEGVIGAGKQRFGSLRVIAKPGEFLLPQHLDATSSGKILVGGAIATSDTIEKALAIGVTGLVVGGINFHDTLGWNKGSDIGLSIVVLEGYGFHSIGDDVYEPISKLDEGYAAIDGERKELLVASSGSAKEEKDTLVRNVFKGNKVRVVAGQRQGTVGEVLEVGTEEELLESGLMTQLVTIKNADGKLSLPWQNLELLD